jgi:predicted oxidoreductase
LALVISPGLQDGGLPDITQSQIAEGGLLQEMIISGTETISDTTEMTSSLDIHMDMITRTTGMTTIRTATMATIPTTPATIVTIPGTTRLQPTWLPRCRKS